MQTHRTVTLGRVDPRSGSATIAPTATTTYQLTARNAQGQVTATATVAVTQPQVGIVSLTANPTGIASGQSSTDGVGVREGDAPVPGRDQGAAAEPQLSGASLEGGEL